MTGLIQYLALSNADGSSPSYAGIITGGSHTITSEVREQRGIGSYKPLKVVPGLINPTGTVDFRVQNALLMDTAERSAGVLSEFGIIAGDTTWAAKHLYCKATGLTLNSVAGEELNASLSWIAQDAEETSGAQTQTAAAQNPMLWNAFTLSGISSLIINSFDISYTHRIVADPTLTTPSATEVRFPTYLHDTGQDMIGFNMTLRAMGGASIVADTLATIATITLTFVSTQTMVITLTNSWLAEKNQDFTPDAVATNGLNYMCEDISWASA